MLPMHNELLNPDATLFVVDTGIPLWHSETPGVSLFKVIAKVWMLMDLDFSLLATNLGAKPNFKKCCMAHLHYVLRMAFGLVVVIAGPSNSGRASQRLQRMAIKEQCFRGMVPTGAVTKEE